ncbi:MAG: hypothetical protein J1F36_03965 [Clostridiales bacterium]|nr:hypothetical protein [Clostridiales bacterium]
MVLSWIMSILAVVALSVVADLLLGGKRMGKFVNAIFASLTILIIVAPVPNIIRNGIDADNILFIPGINVDESYLDYANNLKTSRLARGVVDELSKEGYRNVEVEIKGEFNDEIKITSVVINLSKLVMDEKVVHINKYDAITRLVSSYLGVDKGVIMIYE